MPLSKQEAADLEWSPNNLVEADFEPGENDQMQLAAGQVGEVAIAEVGETATLSEIRAVRVGRPKDPNGLEDDGKLDLDLRSDDADADGTPDKMPDGTEFRLVVRKKSERGGKEITEWFKFGSNDPNRVDTENRSSVTPEVPTATEGRIIGIQIRNRRQAVTYYHNNSTWEVPAIGGT